MCKEFIPRGYDCLDNTDKLLASLLAEQIGLSLQLFDRQQISVFIHAGKHSSFFYVRVRVCVFVWRLHSKQSLICPWPLSCKSPGKLLSLVLKDTAALPESKNTKN